MTFFKKLIIAYFLNVFQDLSALETTDKIAALVNNEIILDSDIQNKINIMQYNTNYSQPSLNNKKLYHKILDQLIINKLIIQVPNQENIININQNQLNQIIYNIAHCHNMTMSQFYTYLQKIGLDHKKYRSEIYQEMIIKSICNHIAKQRLYISSNEIYEITQKLNFIDFNKQFKLTYITVNLPIHASFDEIQKSENLAKLLIQQIKIDDNIHNLINIYYKDNIFPRITAQETQWVSWKDIPPIFDQYLYKTQHPGNIIGPIYSYDGIHILKINDISFKNIFPIIRIKINSITSKNKSNNINIQQQLLNIKKQIDNHNTTFTMITQEKSKDFYLENYKNSSGWVNLDYFDPSIQKSLLNLKKNQISMPIYTINGWSLIKLIDIDQLNYATALRERACSHILYQKFNDIINHWISELKSESYINIINPEK